ncbi:putative glycoside hydrolase [Candidatus Parcubacteria bacterium]|nr:putative glycoside hydrolase [Candidatus Parcubacteria bacterium]
MKLEQKALIGLSILLVATCLSVYGLIPFLGHDTYVPDIQAKEQNILASVSTSTPIPQVRHMPVPAQVKSLYMTSCVAGTKQFRADLVAILDTTELNSIVIDIKDFTGFLSFRPEDPALKGFLSSRCYAPDMKEFIALLHEKGVYVIGRITVFQDPAFVKQYPEFAVRRASDGGIWADRKGINYLDPGAKGVWDHIVAISKESYAIGFDELNFDYIRFPSDGNMSDIAFPHSLGRSKQEVLEGFFSYLNSQLKPIGVMMSADLFGMTATNYDDLNIGQVLERALPYFDFVAPMVYPSHYPPNFNGWPNPNLVPYEIIKYSMDRAVARTIATTTRIKTFGSTPIASTSPQLYSKPAFSQYKLRTWIQDFDYGGNYDIPEVKAQIQATYDAGLNSWMLWAPSNRYTLGALNKE